VQVCLLGKEHDLRTQDGELLSPERFPREAIERLKVQLGDRAAGQLQQRPAPPGGAIFQRAWFDGDRNRYWPHVIDSNLSGILGRWLSFDTAFKDQTSNDYTARVVFELLADYRLLVRDVYRERLQFPDLLRTIEADARHWNADGKLRGIIIEDKGSGTSAGQSLEAAAQPWLRPLLEMFLPVGSKTYRARQAAQWCALDCILLPYQSPASLWLDGFAGPDGRLWSFPTIEHDDDIDAFTQGVLFLERYIAQGYHARTGVAA
jgi:predicted phage terminase large subunit-like protein